MMSGQHEGKLVLKVPAASSESDFPITDCRPFLDADATYLVTGGLGGLGLKLLFFLASSGARHLTLMDRDPQGRRSVDWIRKASDLAFFFPDCEIHIVSGDVAVEEDVQRCIAKLQKPLKGVFHLAGVLDDRSLTDMSPESLARVFAPKALAHYISTGLQPGTSLITSFYFLLLPRHLVTQDKSTIAQPMLSSTVWLSIDDDRAFRACLIIWRPSPRSEWRHEISMYCVR